MARNRGGNRPPANPAPVSGPGALSRRTDQPVRAATGQPYGARAETVAQQQAAPLAVAGSPAAGPQQPPLPPNDAFMPTAFPAEPATAGIPFGPGDNGDPAIPDDPDLLLRMLASIYPDPDIIGLIRQDVG